MVHMFNTMPLAAVVAKKIFCCHGGISESLLELAQLREVVRPTDVADLGVLCDLLWADPSPATRLFDPSPRGVSKVGFRIVAPLVLQSFRPLTDVLVCFYG